MTLMYLNENIKITLVQQDAPLEEVHGNCLRDKVSMSHVTLSPGHMCIQWNGGQTPPHPLNCISFCFFFSKHV